GVARGRRGVPRLLQLRRRVRRHLALVLLEWTRRDILGKAIILLSSLVDPRRQLRGLLGLLLLRAGLSAHDLSFLVVQIACRLDLPAVALGVGRPAAAPVSAH